MRSSSLRRRRWAAIASDPYSTKEPSSTSWATFSPRGSLIGLAPALRPLRAGSRRAYWHGAQSSSARSGRMWSRSIAVSCFGLVAVDLGGFEEQRSVRPASASRRLRPRLSSLCRRAAPSRDAPSSWIRGRRSAARGEPGPLRPPRSRPPCPAEAPRTALRSAPGRRRLAAIEAGAADLRRRARAACEEQRRARPSFAAPTSAATWCIDEIGRDAVGGEIGMREHRLNEGNIGGDATRCGIRARPAPPSARHPASLRQVECTMTLARRESKAALVL